MNNHEELETKVRGQSPPAIKRILVPTDLTPNSEKAVQYGLTLAQRFGAHLTLLYAFKETYAGQYARGPSAYNSSLAEREACREALEAAGKKVREHYPDCSTLFGYGEPNEEILKAAREEQVDLIVISTHHYNWLTRLAFGSDADQILQQTHCPILVLKSESELAPREADLSYAWGPLF
jgi:nucleotide-binding universal stress UspA family protein